MARKKKTIEVSLKNALVCLLVASSLLLGSVGVNYGIKKHQEIELIKKVIYDHEQAIKGIKEIFIQMFDIGTNDNDVNLDDLTGV